MAMKVMITGGSGFIGSNLTLALSERGHCVYDVDLKSPRYSQPEKYMQLDVRNQAALEAAIRTLKPACILHLAAISTIQKGASDPAYTWDVNVNGTEALLNAALASGCQPWIVYFSTDKVYGALPENARQYTEDMSVQPLANSPYDISKAEADRMVLSFSNRLPVVIIRLCNIYGPRDTNLERVVPANVNYMLAGRPGRLNRYCDKNGAVHSFYRDMLYVGDLCEAILKLLDALNRNGERFHGQVINIGAPECLSMEQVLEQIQKACRCNLPPEILCVESASELGTQSMNTKKAKEYLGFIPDTLFSTGIRKTVDWWLTQACDATGECLARV